MPRLARLSITIISWLPVAESRSATRLLTCSFMPEISSSESPLGAVASPTWIISPFNGSEGIIGFLAIASSSFVIWFFLNLVAHPFELFLDFPGAVDRLAERLDNGAHADFRGVRLESSQLDARLP